MTPNTINKDDLDRYLEDNDLVLLLAQKLAGIDEGTGEPCPLCGGEDRFRFFPDIGKFYCRHCMTEGRGYSIYDLIMYRHEIDFPDALKIVAVESGFTDGEQISERTFLAPSKVEPKKIMELQTFDLNEDSEIFKEVHKHRPEIELSTYHSAGAVGFLNGIGGIAIPMYDNGGEVCGYVRYLTDGSKKNSLGSKSGIVGKDARDALLSKRQVKKVFKCAGVSDYLILSKLIVEAGFEYDYYAFTNGAGEMENPGKFEPILRPALEGQTVVVLQDNDTTGEAGAMKWAKHLAIYASGVRIVRPPQIWNIDQ